MNTDQRDCWHRTDEKLPPYDTQILFYTRGFSINSMRLGFFLKKDSFDRANMFVGDGFLNVKNVSHWMLAPNPPQSPNT